MPRRSPSLREAFDRVPLTETETGCLLWGGRVHPSGLPVFNWRGSLGGPRGAWLLAHGPIPAGHVVVQSCGERLCVRVEHLRLMSRGDLSRAAIPALAENAAKTRCPRGHDYDAANTYLSPKGERNCRACHRERKRARYHARKAEAA